MLSFVVFVMFAVIAVNAGFFKHHMHRHHFTIDMNGFHNHGHQQNGFSFHQHGHFGPPPPPVYGPPPFAPNFHHVDHHRHTPECNHKPGDGFGMIPFSTTTNTNTNTMTMSTNIMPFIPNMIINPFNIGPNFPFNPQNPFLNPNQFFGQIPSNIEPNSNNPSNLPLDPLPTAESTFNTNTMTPLDANTAFNGQGSSTPSIFDLFNGGIQPQNSDSPKGSSDATTVTSNTKQNNDNNYNGTGAIATNNDFDTTNQTNVADVDEPTTIPNQGKPNGLDYDIDVRFGDSKNDNRRNQKPLNTIK